jgi:hypothetical protein
MALNRFQNRQIAKIDLTPKVTATFEGKDEFIHEISQIMKGITGWENRRQIAEAAAPIVVNSARMVAKAKFKNQETHYTYNTPKVLRRIKAPAGEGRKVAEYAPGNLMRSIIEIAKRRSKYKKKSYKVIIGPYYRGRGPLGGKERAIYNSMSKIDGYYAHMVYKSAKVFQQEIMIPGLRNVQAQVIAEMRRAALQVVKEETRKAGNMITVQKGG